jgi:uncharacterized membrane protein YbhN (UPF0104 family)
MSETNKKIYHSLLFLFSFLLFAGLVFYVQKNSTSFEKLKSLDWRFVLVLLVLNMLNFILLGLTHKLPLIKNNIHLPFKEWHGLCMVSELFNLLLPAKGGTGIRMLYLNEHKNLGMREFLSMSFAIVLIGFTFLGVAGLIYCHYFLTKNHVIFSLLQSLFIALTVSGFLLMFMTNLVSRVFRIKRKYSPKTYLKDLKLSSNILILWIGMFVLYPIKIFISFKAIGIELSIFDSLEISLILLATSLFQVLPGNIGVKEIVTAYIGKQYGIEFEVALLASLVDRAVLVLYLFPIGFYSYWNLFLEMRFAQINWAKIGASSLIPLRKRLAKVR